jgi:hypothetical protein
MSEVCSLGGHVRAQQFHSVPWWTNVKWGGGSKAYDRSSD